VGPDGRIILSVDGLVLKKGESGIQEPTKQEIAAVQAVKKIITSDIRQHHSIP
jgi:hypothetical protein